MHLIKDRRARNLATLLSTDLDSAPNSVPPRRIAQRIMVVGAETAAYAGATQLGAM